MEFFSPPFTDSNLKAQFRDLSKKLHPDKGGDPEKFSRMKEERDQVIKMVEAWRSVRKARPSVPVKRRSKQSPIIIINLDPQSVLNILNQFKRFVNGK